MNYALFISLFNSTFAFNLFFYSTRKPTSQPSTQPSTQPPTRKATVLKQIKQIFFLTNIFLGERNTGRIGAAFAAWATLSGFATHAPIST